jgi:hypothetical protein
VTELAAAGQRYRIVETPLPSLVGHRFSKGVLTCKVAVSPLAVGKLARTVLRQSYCIAKRIFLNCNIPLRHRFELVLPKRRQLLLSVLVRQ